MTGTAAREATDWRERAETLLACLNYYDDVSRSARYEVMRALSTAYTEGLAEGRRKGLRVRPVVAAFASQMERKLALHDDRPGWQHDSDDSLMVRLREEVNELHVALDRGRHVPLDIVGEAADVANFAMMLADNSGLLEARLAADGKEAGR